MVTSIRRESRWTLNTRPTDEELAKLFRILAQTQHEDETPQTFRLEDLPVSSTHSFRVQVPGIPCTEDMSKRSSPAGRPPGCLTVPEIVHFASAGWTAEQEQHIQVDRCPRCLRLLGKISPEKVPAGASRRGFVADRVLTRLAEGGSVTLSFHDTDDVRAKLTRDPSEGHQLEIRWDHTIDTPVVVCIESGGLPTWRRQVMPTLDGSEAVASVHVEDALGDGPRVLLIEIVSAPTPPPAVAREPGEPSSNRCFVAVEDNARAKLDDLLKARPAVPSVEPSRAAGCSVWEGWVTTLGAPFAGNDMPMFPLIREHSVADSGYAQMALDEDAGVEETEELPAGQWRMRALADQLLSSSPNVALQGEIVLGVDWYASGRLEVWPSGTIRLEPGFNLAIAWRTTAGRIRAFAQVAGVDTPMVLRPEVCSGPQPGEVLECWYVKPEGPQSWAVAWLTLFEPT
ncbi:MAG: hypothetical protein K1X57_13545 [Gemmataceae bacterium]|nr:hypothetical protein [Gemmataceae bacterium]